jgi:polar amino acid transport system substrate-binding protein
MVKKMQIAVYAALLLVMCLGVQAQAQNEPLRFLTVERPPFAYQDGDDVTGFSIDLMRAIAEDLGRDVEFTMVGSFPDMLDQTREGMVDGAIANISITRAREAVMDFSQPIFRSGLQIMVPAGQGGPTLWSTLFRWDLALAIVAAFALLFGGGMLMWVFERGKQPYFDRSAREAMFPSFWWALNLVVNGGFEERMPRSAFGRVFGVFLVISSLFIVGVFVAHITAAVTVEAISGSVHSISDLDGKRVGTTRNSTASDFLDAREVSHVGYLSFDEMIKAFEQDDLDAVVFDGPILAYYAQFEGAGRGQLLARVFRPENYGIAFPADSALREPINVALLRLNETGIYDKIALRWFGVMR